MSDLRSPAFKSCPDCGELRPESEFGRNKRMPDGLARYCKACFGVRSKASYRKRMAEQGRHVRERPDVPEGSKYCPRCGEIKVISEFGSNRAEKSGLAAYCKPCHNRVMAEIKRQKYGSVRSYHLQRRYGITERQADERLEQQGGICLICLRAKAAHVDHDHESGAIRGLLCFSCNGALGQFADEPRRMRAAATYLERHIDRPRWLSVDSEMIEALQRYGRQDDRVTARARERHRLSHREEFRIAAQRKDRCPICESAPAVHVDHCHETGWVRGLLCPDCNTGMGQLRDDPVTLRRAADYLEGRLVQAKGSRLSFTVPDVDPAGVPDGGWGRFLEEEARIALVMREFRAKASAARGVHVRGWREGPSAPTRLAGRGPGDFEGGRVWALS